MSSFKCLREYVFVEKRLIERKTVEMILSLGVPVYLDDFLIIARWFYIEAKL